jgi:hypothetical protein
VPLLSLHGRSEGTADRDRRPSPGPSGIQGPGLALTAHSTGLGCKALLWLGLRWSEGARGQSDFTTCFRCQYGRYGTLGSASGAPQPMPRIGGFLVPRFRAAVLRAKAPGSLHTLSRTSPYECASTTKRGIGRCWATDSQTGLGDPLWECGCPPQADAL